MNVLSEEDLDKIVNTFTAYSENEKYSRVVAISEIEENDFNLNIARYIDMTEEVEEIDINSVYFSIRNREEEIKASSEKLDRLLNELGI